MRIRLRYRGQNSFLTVFDSAGVTTRTESRLDAYGVLKPIGSRKGRYNQWAFSLAPSNRLCHLRATCGERHDPDKTGANHSVGRCSRLGPVSRLQATREPLKGDAERELRRIAWLQRTGQTRTVLKSTGKAFAFTKEQFFLSCFSLPSSVVFNPQV